VEKDERDDGRDTPDARASGGGVHRLAGQEEGAEGTIANPTLGAKVYDVGAQAGGLASSVPQSTLSFPSTIALLLEGVYDASVTGFA
jgi:hypothetical protein